MRTNGRSLLYGVVSLVAAFILIVIDQALKALAVSVLKDKDPVIVIDGVFEFFYLENRGAAFGVFQGARIFFIVLTVAICALAVYALIKTPVGRHFLVFRITLVLLIAGAVGNFIDRLANGYVIDFLYFKLIDFPVFNFADICVTFAEILLILDILFIYSSDDLKEVFGLHGEER
ncbi:MAG: signal peptidase II [Eubacterium sp.]|nr:signal peptidase II [Eubacterium sp.]